MRFLKRSEVPDPKVSQGQVVTVSKYTARDNNGVINTIQGIIKLLVIEPSNYSDRGDWYSDVQMDGTNAGRRTARGFWFFEKDVL